MALKPKSKMSSAASASLLAKKENSTTAEHASKNITPVDLTVKAEAVLLHVEKTIIGEETHGDDEYGGETIAVRKFMTDTARVVVGGEVRKSDNNYGGVKVSVLLSVPCYVEEIDAVYEQTTKKVQELVTKELEEAGLLGASDDEPVDTSFDSDGLDGDEEVSDEGAEEGSDEEGITAEDLLAMSREDLVAFIADNEVDVNPAKIKNTKKLAEAVIEALTDSTDEEEEGDEEDATVAEDEDDDATESEDESDAEDEGVSEDEDEDAKYAEEDLRGATIDELKAVCKSWKLDVKVKKGATPAAIKNAHVEAILEAQGD